MCGIIGYTGSKQAAPVILSALRKLEYRGYDSAGMAVTNNGRIQYKKAVGKLVELENVTEDGTNIRGNVGIGHTRWATHGAPTVENSHPHLSEDESFAVVHNGIIENYAELRKMLEEKGVTFKSETDTEVIPHLLQLNFEGDMFSAVTKTVSMLKGAYALGIISSYEPESIYAVRKGSPLIVGLSDNANYIASDIPAILSATRRVYLLDEGEFAVLNRDGVYLYDSDKNPICKEIFEVDWDVDAAKKDGYEYYMLKEIMEQPRAMRDTVIPRLNKKSVELSELTLPDSYYKSLNKVFIVACGSAYHVGLVGKYVIESLARVPVEVDLASEFRYRNPVINKDDLVVIISQSGETLDTLEALREAKRRGAKILSVVNVKGSSIARESDEVLYTHAGPEIAVATTKAYSTQMDIMFLFALKVAEIRQSIDSDKLEEYISELKNIPDKAEAFLKNVSNIEKVAKKYKNNRDVFFIGRGLDYAIAQEGSLKLKEISYIHSEAYAAGELKHGTISLIEEGTLVIALATQNSLYEKMLSNIREVKSRGATVIAVVMEGHTDVEAEADYTVYVPETLEEFAGAMEVLPLQVLAYYISYYKGLDVDKPRNLAKSVTVE